MNECRFPPPWSVEELDPCFVVRERGGQALGYVYFEDELVINFKTAKALDLTVPSIRLARAHKVE